MIKLTDSSRPRIKNAQRIYVAMYSLRCNARDIGHRTAATLIYPVFLSLVLFSIGT